MMAASHLVSAVQWIAGVITEEVITSKLKEWVSQFLGLGGDVDSLKTQISYVKTVLRMAEGRRIRNTHLTTLLARLHQLVHEADDVLDELDYHRIRQETERAATTNMVSVPSATATATSYAFHLLSDVASHQPLVSPTFREVLMYPWVRRKRRKLAHPTADANAPDQSGMKLDKSSLCRRIRQVTIQLRDVGEQVRKALQLEDLESISPTSDSLLENTRLTTSYPAGEQKMFGRNSQKESIIEVLTDPKCSSQSRLLVLPVIGNGGMGKTTLLQHVYHDQRVRSFFHIRMWIWISHCHNLDVVRLTREMLEAASATGENQNKGSENLNSLQANLVRRLKGKRFLVVFDDLWDVEKNKWEVLLAPLKYIKDTSNCTVLVTIRDHRVAELIKTAPPINLSGLKGEAFWDCFRAYIFGDEKHDGHQHLQDIGRQIASKLNGYPLAAKSVGALLRKDLSIEHWNRVLESREWEAKDGTDGIISILRLSYDGLPFHLKRCFSYCSLFPKGYQFQEKDLVFIWVSQDFVDTRCDKKPEEVGREYLNDLVSLGFFQRTVNLANCHTWYIMHDIIHDLAINVSSDYCLIINRISTLNMQPSGTIRHLSIITDNIYHRDISRDVPRNENFERIVTKIASLMQMRYLRSLMLFGKYDSNFARVFRRAFREATNMRSIIICMTPYHEGSLLHDLGQCIHLRYLKIIADDHEQFPEALNGLYHLQVLDVGGMTCDLSRNVYDIYSGASTQTRLEKPIVLTSLNCLYLDNCKGCKKFPVFSQFPALKKLHLIGMPAVTVLQTGSLEEVILSDMPALETWTVTETHHLIEDLKVVKICDCPKLGDLPLPPTYNSDGVNYRQLQRVVIKNCSCLMVLPPLPLSPKIKLLIEDVHLFPCRSISYSADTHPSLLLKGKDELRVLDGSVLSFRNLLYLHVLSIDGCPSLTSISWEGFHQFRILKDLTIYRCPNLLSIPMTETEQQLAKGLLPSLQRLEIWSCGITGKNLSCLLSNLPHLSFLKLKECRHIRRLAVNQQADQGSSILLPDGAVADGLLCIKPQSLPSLQELCFDSCPIVCENAEGLKGLVTLKILEICECPRFLSYLVFQNEDMHHIEGTCLLPSSLRELKIDHAEWKLMSLHGLTAIERLSIRYSELEALDLQSCMALKYINVHCCPAIWTLQGLQSCVQLRELEVIFTPGFWRAWDLALQRDGASDELSFPVELVRTSDSSILNLSICKHLKHLWRLEFHCLCDKLVMEQEKALEQLMSLNELQFLECDYGFSIPEELRHLTSLKKLEIMSCSTTSSFPERGLPTALEHLVIVDCKYLKSLPAGMHVHSSLKKLEIKSCPQIQSLPRGGLPASLQVLRLEKCSSKLQEQLQRMNKAGMIILWS